MLAENPVKLRPRTRFLHKTGDMATWFGLPKPLLEASQFYEPTELFGDERVAKRRSNFYPGNARSLDN